MVMNKAGTYFLAIHKATAKPNIADESAPPLVLITSKNTHKTIVFRRNDFLSLSFFLCAKNSPIL